jgi:hypothetical protein
MDLKMIWGEGNSHSNNTVTEFNQKIHTIIHLGHKVK